ncbi:SGNH/GDSL hydrolase family protein [Cohnella hashimotonis]|uniref:SGNH/GDSL hydrolase family protein n=1 Tax=Cohnella hashimotonis TaxID=2826895 RepID=A0ABT6TRV5_9BACL|nr:GDSL-type esterase/lipase family protein [Cohnella hashimotonis]MDI4648968.1 SGNH/GDSL hydrolase family protein [Cohnella hashimotonis]
MEYRGVYFHNVAELEAKPGLPGLWLQRFPQGVRRTLTDKGRIKAELSNGCEIRFVASSRIARVIVGAAEEDGTALVYRGNFLHASHRLRAGMPATILLETPERFDGVDPAALAGGGFSPDVWRICFDRFAAVFYGADAYGGELRPPAPDEMPRLTLLAYGSSITQGAGSLNHANGYVQQAAQRLGLDAINLGLSGSCFCEWELSDFISSRRADLVFLELGVNMRGQVPADEFEERAAYLLDRLADAAPGRPTLVTTIYPNRATRSRYEADAFRDEELKFNEVLRRLCSEPGRAGGEVRLVEGTEILGDFAWLTSDLIHPSEYGHIRMGERLADALRPGLTALLDRLTAPV